MFIALVIIMALLLGSYVYAIQSKEILDEEARKSASGNFVTLSQGMVHYELSGPSNGQTVVLVHGFSSPYYVWDNNCSALEKAGFRVLRYDLYGRGFSDRPGAVYDRDLFDRQLLELLKELKINLPVHLVGLSMGGAVSISFVDRHPETVAKLVLISPAGFPVKEGFGVKLSKIPLLGDYLFAVAGDSVVLSRLSKVFKEPGRFPEFKEKSKTQMKYRGYNKALLSTLRNMHMHSLREAYERVGKQNKAVLLIWGRDDQILPFTNSEKVRKAISHLEFHAIEDAGHVLNYENPGVVNPLLINFLTSK